jgi:hypothetical protein
MHFVWRAIVVWLIVFAGCLLGAATQWILPADHLAQAKVAIGSMQGLVILLLALVLGLLVWTSYGVYSQQQTETQTLVSQILQLDLALDHHGPEAERGRDLLKNELIETRERFWGRDPHANLLTYAQTRAELRSMDRFFGGLKPADDEQRHALDTARQLSASILETHYLMSRQLSVRPALGLLALTRRMPLATMGPAADRYFLTAGRLNGRRGGRAPREMACL